MCLSIYLKMRKGKDILRSTISHKCIVQYFNEAILFVPNPDLLGKDYTDTKQFLRPSTLLKPINHD